jgi:hypothetical protein
VLAFCIWTYEALGKRAQRAGRAAASEPHEPELARQAPAGEASRSA